MTDYGFLAPEEDDAPHIRVLKTELSLVMEMDKPQRVYFYQEQRVKEAERQLQLMVDRNQRDENHAAHLTRQAQSYVTDYGTFGGEELLDAAELCAELATNLRRQRYNIGDIRKQRESTQWERKKLNRLTPPASEPKPSSGHSKT